MSGYTDSAFRDLCKAHGADVLLTEFVQATPLVRDIERAWRTIHFPPHQRPAGIQIFGATPGTMAHAARLLQERLRPDFIDINLGCPAHKVVEQNAGAALLRTPALLQEIATAVVNAVPCTPVTAKIRLGWDATSINATDTARRLEDAGVRALAIHGRTRAQGYSGEADWGEIARVTATVTLPVIGNGDLRDAATARKRWQESGVSALMIGRAALGNPWLFREIHAALHDAPPPPPPTPRERLATLLTYARALATHDATAHRTQRDDDAPGLRWILPKLYPFIHSVPGSRKLREKLSACHTLGEMESLLTRTEWADHPSPSPD
jgi:nifR3 family TIM-barrel protein